MTQTELEEFVGSTPTYQVTNRDCQDCDGIGEYLAGDEVYDCPRCKGTGRRHCRHGAVRAKCPDPECVCAEVLEVP